MVSQLSGDVVLTGTFEDSIDFGGGALESAGLKDGFVVKLGADGAQLWSRRFGGPVEDGGLAVTVDGHERVYFCGYYQHVVDMGQGPLKSQGAGDILVAKLEPTGETMWAHSFGGSAWDEGAGLSLGEDKNLTVVGSFQGSAAFGATDLNSAGSADVFVLQLGP